MLWIFHREKRIKRRGNRMEKCDKTGINTWWLGRHPGKKRIGNCCPCKGWQNLEKELENKNDNQHPAVQTLVKNVLLYNCGTWGLPKEDQRKLNSFHRRQLRNMIGIQWPHKISNNKLYKIKGTKPLSITITERRWKLLGHILRLPAKCPARKAMGYYFEERTNKIFCGRKRTTIASTLNENIKQAKEDDITFPVTRLVSQVSLQNLYTKAKNRKLRSKIVKQIVKSAYSKWSRRSMPHSDRKEKRLLKVT